MSENSNDFVEINNDHNNVCINVISKNKIEIKSPPTA